MIDLTALRTELREHTGLDSADLPDANADLLLNRAYWELLDKFSFREKEVSATFITVAGTRKYQVPTPFEALRLLSIEDKNSKLHTLLERETISVAENEYTDTTDMRGKPVKYYREGNVVNLRPTPDDAYEITIKYWTTLADLASGSDVPGMPTSWHEMILYGAVYRGFLRIGDHARAQSIKAQQIALINSSVPQEAKEEFDSHTAGMDVKWGQPRGR